MPCNLFPAVVAAFLLQHTLQGWCPPLPVLRRLPEHLQASDRIILLRDGRTLSIQDARDLGEYPYLPAAKP